MTLNSKTAVSVSLGSDTRDKEETITLLGTQLHLRREGWNGDVAAVTARFEELDGQVDAMGVGGIDLWLTAGEKRYPLHSAHKLIKNVRHTPIVDGSGLKNTLEKQVVAKLINELGPRFRHGRVLLPAALDRWGMASAFFEQGYEVICGELGFALGLPIPIRSQKGVKQAARWLTPIVTRLPISVLYPTGQDQHEIVPKYEAWYDWADVIAGDCHYIRRHMPDDLTGKIIITNTTTAEDRDLFAERGVTHVITTTPIIDGRSFGTNMLEAGLTAVSGKNRPLTYAELDTMIKEIGLTPTITQLA